MKTQLILVSLTSAFIGAGIAVSVQSSAQGQPPKMMAQDKMRHSQAKTDSPSMRLHKIMTMPMNVQMTGKVDTDFAMMMAAHHTSGIEMAKVELLYGKKDSLKKIAQHIISSQTQERAILLSNITTPPKH